jgi:hypothetical protein
VETVDWLVGVDDAVAVGVLGLGFGLQGSDRDLGRALRLGRAVGGGFDGDRVGPLLEGLGIEVGTGHDEGDRRGGGAVAMLGGGLAVHGRVRPHVGAEDVGFLGVDGVGDADGDLVGLGRAIQDELGRPGAVLAVGFTVGERELVPVAGVCRDGRRVGGEAEPGVGEQTRQAGDDEAQP